MRKLLLPGLLLTLLAAGWILLGKSVSAQNPDPTATPPPLESLNGAVRTTNPLAPNSITSLPMSNPYCAQPDPALNQCSLNVRYFQANDNGTGNILAYVNLSVDGKLRFRSNAFFETFVYYTYDMMPNGIKVSCGLPNEGGFGSLYGKAYTIDVKAYDSSNNWVLDDQLNVKCPAFNP